MFSKNNATFGAGILLQHAKGYVSNCSFLENRARQGGAIRLNTAFLDISNSSIANNVADFDGGMISLVSMSTVNISDCRVQNNTAGAGGALRAVDNSQVYIRASIFTGNRATLNGGTLLIYWKAKLFVSDSVFYNSQGMGSGGSIAVEAESYAYLNNIFIYNSFAPYGGALEVIAFSELIVKNSNFIDIEAGSKGGLLYFTQSMVTLINTKVEGSVSKNTGGIYLCENSQFSISNSNHSKSQSGTGGAINSLLCNITLSRACFSQSVSRIGGALYSIEGTLQMDHCEFEYNEANFGGAIHADAVHIQGSFNNFHHNQAQFYGGAMSLVDSTYTSYSETYDNNRVKDGTGGALYIEGTHDISVAGAVNSSILMRNAKFTSNNVSTCGAAMYIFRSFSYFHSSVFSKNRGLSCGALHALDSILEIRQSKFENNAAMNSGAAGVEAEDNTKRNSILSPAISFENVSFIKNYGHLSGAINSLGIKTSINFCYFRENNAFNGYGGAIKVDHNSVLDVIHSTFLSNSAKFGPGFAIFISLYIFLHNCI